MRTSHSAAVWYEHSKSQEDVACTSWFLCLVPQLTFQLMIARAAFIPDQNANIESRVLSAVTQGSAQLRAPVDIFDIAQMEDLSLGATLFAVGVLTAGGQIQLVQGTTGYVPSLQQQ